MKKIYRILFLGVIVCGLLALVGCIGGRALSKPANLRINQATLELRWSAVPDATYYTLHIEGGTLTEAEQERSVSKNSFSLEILKEGDYVISVKAMTNDEQRRDSAWSEKISFTREHETGLRFTLINANTEYEVSGMGTAPSDVVVPDIYRGRPVTRVGERAFRNRALTSIVLGNNIVKIGADAFNNCSYLESITIPDSVTSIGAGAFQSCRTLKTITIPDSVTSIGAGAFQYCNGVTSATIGSGITEIASDLFSGCRALSEVVIPDTVTTIGANAFSECNAVTRIVIGQNVTSIGEYAFYRNGVAEELVFKGDRVVTIGQYAFSECKTLKTVSLPASLVSLGGRAFEGCTSLEEIVLNGNIEQIGRDAFNGTKYYREQEKLEEQLIYLDGWVIGVTSEHKADYSFEVKDGTVGIGAMAFRGCGNFTQMILPDSVKVIDDYAFFACPKLTSVVIGSGVERIGVQAFYSCELLRNVILGSYDFASGTMTGSSLKMIDAYAFMDCPTLESIEIPESVTSIGSYAFRNSGLWKKAIGGVVYAGNWLVDYDGTRASNRVTVREGTVGVANYAFYNSPVSTVLFPDSVTKIGRAAFYRCASLTSVSLPSRLEAIEDYTFYRCSSLTGISIPETVKSIGRSAFYECSVLGAPMSQEDKDALIQLGEILGVDVTEILKNDGKLIIPDSVETIGDYAFYRCGASREEKDMFGSSVIIPASGFEELIIGNGVKSVGYCAFAYSESLKTVTIGSGIETIGERAFYKCTALEEVSLGENLKDIGERAFYRCIALRGISIPDGVSEIKDYTFYRCVSLAEVDLGNISSIGNYAFYGCETLADVFFPESVHEIGKQAFRNCNSLTSVILGNHIETIGMHAFYGSKQLTIYAELASEAENWSERWNSSYRPVIWNCTLSEDKSYVVSITMKAENISNKIAADDETNHYSTPCREGYECIGWSTTSGGEVEYTAETMQTAPEGKTLYAVYTEKLPEVPETPSEEQTPSDGEAN